MIPRLEIHFSLADQWQFIFGKASVPKDNVFLLNHARTGLLLALQATGFPVGSRVGVMVYNCHTVMNAVEQAGYLPVFLDINDKLKLDLDDLRRKVEGMSALVVTHLFGIVNDVKRIKEMFPGLIIIEDCAHAYGMTDLHGDFAVFSIGQGKFPSIGDGGILWVLNKKYKDSVKTWYSELPRYSFFQNSALFFKLLVNSWMYSPLLYGWITLPMKKRRGITQGKVSISPRKMSTRVQAVYVGKEDRVTEMISLRKKKASELLADLPQGEIRAILGENAFMLVLFCDNPVWLKAFFRHKGIDTETHFAHAFDWARSFGYVWGMCPQAESLINHLLMVPTYCIR